ncbi:hypothetical protein PFISCL1PPCAC_12958, partial [Pristionchus fissidentatus]
AREQSPTDATTEWEVTLRCSARFRADQSAGRIRPERKHKAPEDPHPSLVPSRLHRHMYPAGGHNFRT